MTPNPLRFCPACESGELRGGPYLVRCSDCGYALRQDLYLSFRRIRALPETEPARQWAHAETRRFQASARVRGEGPAERSATGMGSGNRRRVTHLPPSEGRAVWTAGGTYTFKAVGEDTDGAFVLLEGTVSPQAGPPPHVHTREDEFIYVLEGELEVLDGERAFMVSAGSYVYIPRHTLHAFKNLGETTAKILIGFAPAGFEGYFFEVGLPARKGESAPTFREEELRRALRAAPKYGLEAPPPPEQ